MTNNEQQQQADKNEATLEINSKHLIDSIQLLYRTGVVRDNLVVTREWCHYVLQQLGNHHDTSSSSSNKKNSGGGDDDGTGGGGSSTGTGTGTDHHTTSHNKTVSVERTQRAEALLDAMKLLESPEVAQHASSLPFALPSPNGRTYRLVLDMYARTSTSTTASGTTVSTPDLSMAESALALVLGMQQDFQRGADLDRQPTVVDWNMVLQAYANSSHPRRAVHVVEEVFLKHMLPLVNKDNPIVDASSLLFVARACGYRVPTPEAQGLGAEVAAKVWERLVAWQQEQQQQAQVSSSLMATLTSPFYGLFLQTIRHLPPSDQRERLFEDVFNQARQHGKLNAVIVKEFIIHAKPLELVQRALGEQRLLSVRGLEPTEAASKLVAEMPLEWTMSA